MLRRRTGADLFLFDLIYELSRNSVVPTFLRLMRGGLMDQWLLELMATHEDEHDSTKRRGALSGLNPVGFWDSCTYLDSEFAVTRTFDRPKV
jgi:hypothetical protein